MTWERFVRDLWKRLERHLAKHAPAVLPFLNPPATDAAIRAAEKKLGVRLPPDLADSLRVHDGQPEEAGKPPHPIPLVPAEHTASGVYRATWGCLASLSHLVERTLADPGMIPDIASLANDFEYEGPVRRDGVWSWLVFVDSGSGDTLTLDLDPAEGGQVGQVLSSIHDPSCLLVLAPGYREWFETLVTRYESGRYVVAEDDDGEFEAIDTFATLSDDSDADDPGTNILRFPR